ncbi:MAG: molybdopterin-dependent oxidoreductase [Candidatus Asgardarchaeia archaeon]
MKKDSFEMFFNTCPRDCYDTCGIITYVKEGLIIKIEGNKAHPITRGFLCPKGYLLKEYTYHNTRLTSALIRKGGKGDGIFEKVSIDHAINFVARKMKEIISKYGSQAIIHYEYAGNSGLLSFYFPQRLFNYLNTSRFEYTICDLAGEQAIELHYGKRYGRPPNELLDSKLIIFWGFNPAASSIHIYTLAKEAKENGTKIITIDPIKTKTAELGQYIRIKPGTDIFLAAGISKYIVENNLYNKEFIEKYTTGFSKFVERLNEISFEEISEITGVTKEAIFNLAAEYATKKPNLIYIGIGVQKQKFGAEIVRWLSLLPALIGEHRGFYFCNNVRDFDYAYLSGLNLRKKETKSFPMQKIGEVVNRDDIKMIFIYNSNPAATAPNADLVKKGLSREDLFVVVHDLFLTDTAELADVVIPAKTSFEILDVYVSYWHNILSITTPAVKAPKNCLSNVELTKKLALSLGINHYAFYESEREIIQKVLEKSILVNDSLDTLFKKGFIELKTYPIYEYQTPSGKIEFYSQLALQKGLDPLPRLVKEDIPEEFPFRLISSSHPRLIHSQYYNIQKIEPFVMINPEDANNLGITDGDYVYVYNQNGYWITKAKVSDNVPKRVLWTFRTPWRKLDKWGKNLNSITSDDTQEIASGVTTNSTFVNVRKF